MQHISELLKDFQKIIVHQMQNNSTIHQVGPTFFGMKEYPLPNPEALDMSVQVLLYDKDDVNNVYVGFYNYDLDKWLTFGNDEDVSEFGCWCYPPKPNFGRMQRKSQPINWQIINVKPDEITVEDFDLGSNDDTHIDLVIHLEKEPKRKSQINDNIINVINLLELEPKEGFNNRHLTPLPKEKCIIEIFMNESRNERVDLCEWTPFYIANYIFCEMPSEGYLGTARLITGKYKGIGYHAWMQNNYEFIYWRHIQGNATFSSEIGPNPNHSLS